MTAISRSVAAAVLAASVLTAAPARSAIVDAADHSYLTDTATNLDWLDVTTTAGMSFNYVSSQLGVGGQFAGWRYATGNEFNTLVSNYSGIAITAGNYGQVNMEPDRIDGLVTLLGNTLDMYMLHTYGVTWDAYMGIPEGNGVDYTYGMLADSYPGAQYIGIIYDVDIGSQVDFAQAYHSGFSQGSVNLAIGSYLVRQHHLAAPIPEPDTYAMLLAGLGLIGLSRRRLRSA